MSPEEYYAYIGGRMGRRIAGSIAILIGIVVAAMMLRTPLVCQLNSSGLSNTQLFWIITGITAGIIMLGEWLWRKNK
jgi:hypothetical protein